MYVGQPREQEIVLLTVDASFDMYLQYKMANRFIPNVIAASDITVPAGVANVDEYLVDQADKIIQDLFGQRDSRLKAGNAKEPFSFVRYPPGSQIPKAVRDTLTGTCDLVVLTKET
ncbi:hypothetical protein UCRPC4_g00846 [Phaeomoniella chlamydospora]|uniref:Uncharacterized protein n=1 Tax=Phaeomoniella chlamydospora TaxID=158046 RepID=A0A0G2F0Q0_PHACM|nr:hypothetical protein UCRPC4_g00846 [Phaeomoniella chlamydospora]